VFDVLLDVRPGVAVTIRGTEENPAEWASYQVLPDSKAANKVRETFGEARVRRRHIIEGWMLRDLGRYLDGQIEGTEDDDAAAETSAA